MTECAIPVAADDAFTALANRRRRHVICILTRTTGQIAVAELADNIAAIEQQCRPGHVSSSQRMSVYVSLIQNHLARLDTLGLVDYEDRAKQVTATAATAPLAHYIHHLTTICTHSSVDQSADQQQSQQEVQGETLEVGDEE